MIFFPFLGEIVMAFRLGPILSFRGAGNNQWRLSVLVVKNGGAPTFECADAVDVSGFEAIHQVGNDFVYRCLFTIPLAAGGSAREYRVDGIANSLHLPGAGKPPHMAYGSCNGFSSAKLMKGVADKNRLWKEMAVKHGERPFHLLLLGGDQVYADSMWDTVKLMKQWVELPYRKGNEVSAPKLIERMQKELKLFYFDLYVTRWSQPEVASMFASIPSIAMWDDHDLIDGWGSYKEDRQDSPVFQQAIWPAASQAFRIFQHQLKPGDRHPAIIAPPAAAGSKEALTLGHVVGPIAILALDMRTERTDMRVLSEAHWNAVYGWIEALDESVRHLLVMSSIPVVYPGFDTLERLFGFLPGHQDLEDDLRDHWNSRPHKGERLRLVHRLLSAANSKKLRPTLISGDVHVAALGYIESSRDVLGSSAVINQLISSGIVHPGPGGAVLFALRHLFDNKDEMDRGITARMVEFPGTQEKFVGGRNFLTLRPDNVPHLWAEWWVEGKDAVEKAPYTKVIHALDRG